MPLPLYLSMSVVGLGLGLKTEVALPSLALNNDTVGRLMSCRVNDRHESIDSTAYGTW